MRNRAALGTERGGTVAGQHAKGMAKARASKSTKAAGKKEKGGQACTRGARAPLISAKSIRKLRSEDDADGHKDFESVANKRGRRNGQFGHLRAGDFFVILQGGGGRFV